MECAECGIRSAVGYCGECETLLCEVCGRTCTQCGKIACRSHLQRTSSGRNICVSCVVQHYDKRARQSKERRERRAEEVAMGGKTKKHHRHASESENLSFEALAREQGPVSIPIAVHQDHDDEPDTGHYAPAPPPSSAYSHGPLYDKEALNARVLTGSASTRTPPWLSGLGLGILAWLLTIAAGSASAASIQAGILSGVALLVALGAILWTASGAFATEGAPARGRCRLAMLLSASAALFAVLLCIQVWT